MRKFIVLILLFFGSIAYSQEWNSQLTIKCPIEYELSLNGYVQTLKGDIRQFGFNLPKGNIHIVRLLIWNKENVIIYNKDIELKGGENNIVDITQKVLPQKPKKGFEKPNFKDIIKCEDKKSTSVVLTSKPEICVTY